MASLFRAAFPSGPLVDTNGGVTAAWRGFFQSLYARTGNANGLSSDTSVLEAELEAERQARIAGDLANASAVSTERTMRQAADTAETSARIAADALLVPRTELCSLWAGCDLSFLPTTDPGSGQPWLDGSHLVVGTPAIAIVGIGLEDGTGRWGLEDGTGAWLWG
ncbi:MAG TPA: hypothetical protein VGH84_01475 [Steroidobacteraceae bacterium]